MKLLRDMWGKGWVSRMMLVLAVLLVLMIPAAIYGSIQEAKKWKELSVSHNCKKKENVKGDVQTGVGYGMTSNGQIGVMVMTSSTPERNGWICDDGVIYWR